MRSTFFLYNFYHLSAHRLVFVFHIVIECCQNGHLKKRVNPWQVNDACHVKYRSTGVMRQDIRVLHQWQTSLAERLTEIVRHISGIGVLRLHLTEEVLEVGCCLLLLFTPALIEIVKNVFPESAFLGQ